MKVTLRVEGRELTFLKVENITIDEESILNETTKEVTTTKVAQKPTKGEWFQVKPLAIDQTLFGGIKENERQKATQSLILEAFKEMEYNPDQYGRNFKTLIPKKTWRSKTVEELQEIASKLGDQNTDWVEQALEWAQRIANGESWETICNERDTIDWHRLVVWKNGHATIIGGSAKGHYKNYPAYVSGTDLAASYVLDDVVPSVVRYDE